MVERIGFACKFVDERKNISEKQKKEKEEYMNMKGTTITHLNKLSQQESYEKLFNLVSKNIKTLKSQIEYVSSLPQNLRMMRIGSDILPAYTHQNFLWFYKDNDVQNFLEKMLKDCGDLARKKDCRMSFHPGQFCILNSTNSEVIENAVKEFEYHADVARMMGYTQWHENGFAINIHGGNKKGGIELLRKTIQSLSCEARNLITIENDEISFGFDDVLEISDTCAVILDIHHEWVYSGEYIRPNDDRVKRMIDSWRGIRPKIHYSLSRFDLVSGMYPDTKPDMNTLLNAGHKKQKLRSHSDYCWNRALNEWALSFLPKADIMVETKKKNVAAKQLYDQWMTNHS